MDSLGEVLKWRGFSEEIIAAAKELEGLRAEVGRRLYGEAYKDLSKETAAVVVSLIMARDIFGQSEEESHTWLKQEIDRMRAFLQDFGGRG